MSALFLLASACKKDVIPPPDNSPVVQNPNPAPQDTTPNWNLRFVGSYHGTWQEINYSLNVPTVVTQFDTTLVITAGVPDSTGMTAGAIDSTNTISFQASASYLTTVKFDADSHYYNYYQSWVTQAKIHHDTLDYARGYPIGMAGSHNYTFKGKKIQ